MTDVIKDNDLRASNPEMRDSISSEVLDLLKSGTFTVLLQEELPVGSNAFTPRFVLAIKSNADGKIKYKTRYVISGHRDRLEPFLFHSAHSLQASSVHLLLATA